MITNVFGRRGLLAIFVLLLINTLNVLDRVLPFVLVDAIRKDLGLTDSEIGLMTGVGFGLIYAVAALPLARVADRHSSRVVLSLTLAFWSLMTALSGFAQNFMHLLLARGGVAAAEAGSAPAGHALVARAFPAERRALVLAIVSLGFPLGSMLGLMLGGWIADVANWRAAFFFVGAPGLLVALMAWFLLPEPGKVVLADNAEPAPFWNTLKFLFSRRSYRHMAMAGSLYTIAGFGITVWSPAFLMRTYHMTAGEVGMQLGLATGIGGLIGLFASGWISDWLGGRDVRWRQWVPAIAMALGAVSAFAAISVPGVGLAILFLAFVQGLGYAYLAPTFAAVQSLVADDARATASAVLLFCMNLLGPTIGPFLVGSISDRMAPSVGELSLQYALLVVPVLFAWAALHFALAGRALPGDMPRAQPAATRDDGEIAHA